MMKSTTLHSYLTFNGNCREAMQFYKECLGGELYFQAAGDAPSLSAMPLKMKDCIVHSTLTNGDFVLMGSDMVEETGLIKGNAVSLLLDCSSAEELKDRYTRLATGGKAVHPPAVTFWGSLFGDLTDKYGNHWILNCSDLNNN